MVIAYLLGGCALLMFIAVTILKLMLVINNGELGKMRTNIDAMSEQLDDLKEQVRALSISNDGGAV